MAAKFATVLAIFGDLRMGALFEQHDAVYRKTGRRRAKPIDPAGPDRAFASFESVRAAAFLYGG